MLVRDAISQSDEVSLPRRPASVEGEVHASHVRRTIESLVTSIPSSSIPRRLTYEAVAIAAKAEHDEVC